MAGEVEGAPARLLGGQAPECAPAAGVQQVGQGAAALRRGALVAAVAAQQHLRPGRPNGSRDLGEQLGPRDALGADLVVHGAGPTGAADASPPKAAAGHVRRLPTAAVARSDQRG